MIARIRGTILELKPTEVVVEAGGVGYQLCIPLSTYEKIEDQHECDLYVYTLHKEDQLRLFGFHRPRERELFTILLGVNGIGPNIALSILSGIDADTLLGAVRADDPALLMRVPGIGKSKAEKLIFELRRKEKKLEKMGTEAAGPRSASADAVEALVYLGFEEKRAAGAVEQILRENPSLRLEDIIKKALAVL